MIIKSAYIASGMGLGVLGRMVAHHGVGMHFGCLYRLGIMFFIGMMTSLIALLSSPFHLIYRHRRMRTDPIFIVGHWRTGSTYLHELFALDPRLSVPTTLLCTSPCAYPLSRILMAPIMLLATRGNRPMDNVRIGPRTPQEDEFALFRLTGFSPMRGLLYPPRRGYFLNDMSMYLPSEPGELGRFDQALRFVVRTVQGFRGRRPVLKNPAHTLRIPHLRQLFPDAAFVHIRRDPSEVIPSTMRMWSVLGPQNTLRGTWTDPGVEEVIEVYNRIERAAKTGLADLPGHRKVEVSYARLVAEPTAVLEEVYAGLGLPVSAELRRLWVRKTEAARKYRKNRHALSDEDASLIRSLADRA